jgi:dihydrofolate reductase
MADEKGGPMRKLTVNTFVTLDGVMQAPGGPGEDPSGGFKHEGWSVNYWDDTMGQVMGQFMGKPFDLLLGRKTYEIFAAHWPRVTNDPAADALNSAKKHVASRTLESVEWQNSTLITSDVAKYVAALKEQSGPEIQVHGSGNLLQTLMKHDLIDEFQLMIFPILLGTGKRLFADGTIPAGLKLVESQTASTGVVIARYERAGDVKYGSFALEESS